MSPALPSRLYTSSGWFRDEAGRHVLLRGVNLGGSSKIPASPNGATHIKESLDIDRPVSFIGRPFSLAEADEHFGRIRHWGFNVLRLLTTWEAIEHEGPGQYDIAYLDWFAQIVERAGAHGFAVLIDPHQDAWGRWSGGDGAPLWTYTAVGLNPDQFDVTEAAVTMQRRPTREYAPMAWTSNGARFATRTMRTLFFAGNDFAPQARIDDEPIQDYLQRHFLEAMAQLARRLQGMPHVLGYGFLNEASGGYIGQRLDQPLRSHVAGPRLTGFDGMVAAAGVPRRVPTYRQFTMAQVRYGTRILNPEGHSAWLPNAPDIWREAGVWRFDGETPTLLRPDHFLTAHSRAIDFATDYLKPCIKRFAESIRVDHPHALIFVENGILSPPNLHWDMEELPGLVNATHWYDAVTLFGKVYIPWFSFDVYTNKPVFGASAIRRMFVRQIGDIRAAASQHMGDCPTVIGEFGVPYDLIGGSRRNGNWNPHTRLLERYYDALDANLVSATQWNYTADNDNHWGDQWNRENLSIFSSSEQDDPANIDSGGRAVEGFCRPFVRRTAGLPTDMRFDRISGRFELHYTSDPAIVAPTEIFVPHIQYPNGYDVEVSSGQVERQTADQLLFVHDARADQQWIVVRCRQ